MYFYVYFNNDTVCFRAKYLYKGAGVYERSEIEKLDFFSEIFGSSRWIWMSKK